MFVSHFFAGTTFLVVVLDRLFFIWETKKWLLVVLDRSECIEIHLGGLSIGRLTQVVILQRWSSKYVQL